MPAASYDILVEQGIDYPFKLRLANRAVPVDWTGFTARFAVATSRGADAVPLFALEAPGDITFSSPEGWINIPISATLSRSLPSFEQFRLRESRLVRGRRFYQFGFFDLNLTDQEGASWRPLSGGFYVAPEVIA